MSRINGLGEKKKPLFRAFLSFGRDVVASHTNFPRHLFVQYFANSKKENSYFPIIHLLLYYAVCRWL